MHTIRMGKLLKNFGGARISSHGQVESAIKLATAFAARDFDLRADKTSKDGLVAFTNGTLDCTKNPPVFRENDPKDHLTKALDYDYDPEGDFPLIRAFQEAVMPDEVSRDAYAAHVGLAALRDLKFHKALILVGGKNSGKSTLYQLANVLCGNEEGSGPDGHIFSEEQEGMRSRAVWNSKLICCIDEIPSDAMRHEGTTKAMLAHQGVSMRHLNQREETNNRWRPKVLMTANSEPATPTPATRWGAG